MLAQSKFIVSETRRKGPERNGTGSLRTGSRDQASMPGELCHFGTFPIEVLALTLAAGYFAGIGKA
jgi:hypothetical protein